MTIAEQIARKEQGIKNLFEYLNDRNLCHIERKSAEIKLDKLTWEVIELEKK